MVRSPLSRVPAVLIAGSIALSGSVLEAAPQDFWAELEDAAPATEWTCYPQPDPLLEERIWDLVNQATSGELEPSLVQDELFESGPACVPVLFAILMGEVRDERALSTPDPDAPPSRTHSAPRVEDLVYEALSRQPGDEVVAHLRAVITPEAPAEARVLAARVLSGAVDSHAFEAMIEVAAGLDPFQLQRPYLRGPFSDALARLLGRDPSQFADVEDVLEDQHDAVVLLVVESLPEERVNAGLPVVLAMFGRNESLDLAAMEKLAELAASPRATGEVWSSLECLRMVRRQLESKSWKMRRQAAVAAARLHDLESLDRLIKMLEDEHRSVQRTALWSLHEMTGQRFGVEPRAWKDWLDSERAWFEGPRTDVEWNILSGLDADVIEGIRDLLQHPLYRDSAADLLGPLLVEAPPGVFAAAQTALVQLDSPRGVAYLVPCLELEDDAVRTSSWRALRSLTALDLPAEREVWEDELGI